MLLYQTLHARWNENDIQNFLKTVGFLQKYNDIKTPAPGFDFETCSAQPSILPTPQPFVIYFDDILMGRFVISQTPENTAVVQTVVRCSSWKGIFLKLNTPFGADFEICNFVDLFMPKHTNYTLTKIQKVKKHNPLTMSGFSTCFHSYSNN